MNSIPSWVRFCALALACQFIIGSEAAARAVGSYFPPVWWNLVIRKLLLLAAFLLIATQTLRADALKPGDLGLHPPMRSTVVWTILAGVLLASGAAAFHSLAAPWFGFAPVNAGVAAVAVGFDDGPGTWTAILLSVGLLAPLTEEFLWRAYPYESFLRAWGSHTKSRLPFFVVSTAGFAAVHSPGHPVYYIYFAVLGGWLGFIYHRTRSMSACILAHATLNLTGVAIALARGL